MHPTYDELLKLLRALLEEAEGLREAYDNARQYDGWDEVPEEPIFNDVRAALAAASKEP